MPRPRGLLAAVLILLLTGVAIAREPARGALPDARLRDGLRAVVRRLGPARKAFGLQVARAGEGVVVFSSGARVPLIPASTMKVATSASALLVLGPDHVFWTRIVAAATPGPKGAVAGDLVVRGGGDPSLRSDRDLPALARAVRRAGVREVRGDLVIDDGLFDRVLRHPEWPRDQLSRGYCAPVCAVSLDRARLHVTVRPGAGPEQEGIVSFTPYTRAVALENAVVTTAVRKEHRIFLKVDIASGRLHARGRVWTKSTGYETDVAMPDPAICFGHVLRQALAREGVTVAGKVVRRAGAASEIRSPVLLAERGTPLFVVLDVMNRESDNHFAECVLKAVGHAETGEGSFPAGCAATARLADAVGAPASEIAQADGSGLSRSNRVSANFLCRVLVQVYRSRHSERFLATLAAGGDAEGTLRKRLKDLGGDVRAKTGTIRGVSCLAGYVQAKSGRVLCFAVLVNDRKTPLAKARAFQDEICRLLHREG